jgi:hypothetical protein
LEEELSDHLNDACNKFYSSSEHIAEDKVIVLFKGRAKKQTFLWLSTWERIAKM